MKEQLRKADLLGLVIIAAAMIAYSIRSLWTVYQTVAVVVGAVLVIASLLVKRSDIRSTLGRRSTKFGINSATSVVLFIGILALVNYLGVRNDKRIDMTTEQIHSLAEQSVNVAEQVPEELRITAFYPGGEYLPARDLLARYRNVNSNISFEFIDPDQQPQLAQQHEITAYGDFQNPMSGESFRFGTLILEMGGRTDRVEKQSQPLREEDVTNALMRVVKGEQKVVYFVQGHGEKSIENTERTGMNIARDELQKDNYLVNSVNLVQEGKVPDDATVLVIAGPTAELFSNEVEMIDAFISNGGSALVMLDPAPSAALAEFMTKWSIEVGNNIVVDASGVGRLFGMGPAAPLVTNYGDHPIVQPMRVMSFFPLTRSVSPAANPAEGVTIDPLLATAPQSWGETEMAGTEAAFDEGVDLEGPVTIALVATKTGGDVAGRLVVYGDSDFASNMYYGQAGNGTLFANSVAWLARDESFISIGPRDPTNRPLTMTEAQSRLVSYVAVLLLPVGILVAGISVWMKRRK